MYSIHSNTTPIGAFIHPSLEIKKCSHETNKDTDSDASSLDSELEDELKIEKLGRDYQPRSSAKVLNNVAPRFKKNIIIQTQQKR